MVELFLGWQRVKKENEEIPLTEKKTGTSEKKIIFGKDVEPPSPPLWLRPCYTTLPLYIYQFM